jgi:hypothetical protein
MSKRSKRNKQSKSGRGRRQIAAYVCVFIVIAATTSYVILTRLGQQIAPEDLSLIGSITLDGGANGDDWAVGMVYDENTHVLYVTGFITVLGEGMDVWIAKFDSSLHQISNVTFSGPAHGDDMGYSICLGTDGYLYIVGYVVDALSDRDIWIAKYYTNLTLDSYVTVDGSMHQTDDGYGIAFDNDGNLLVAGTLTNVLSGYDIYIGKYDTDLNLLLNITLDGPSHMTDKARFFAVTSDGSIFVSGSMSQAGSNYDIWLAKLDSELNILEQRIIAGPTTGEDKGYGIALASDGTLFAVGTMTIEDEGLDIWLAAFDANLELLRNVTISGPSGCEDAAYSLFLESDGDLVLTGVYTELDGGSNILVAKFKPDFTHIQTLTFDGSDGGYDSGFGIILTSGREVFVSGFTTSVTSGMDIWLAGFEYPII